jgi:hypothetical protein
MKLAIVPPATNRAWYVPQHLGNLLLACLPTSGPAAWAANFTSGTDTAVEFGVHEIVLTGDGSVANPFDTIATVNFVPPSGQKNAKTVHGFHDADDTWAVFTAAPVFTTYGYGSGGVGTFQIAKQGTLAGHAGYQWESSAAIPNSQNVVLVLKGA